jgi:Alpha/beta hydrolase domain
MHTPRWIATAAVLTVALGTLAGAGQAGATGESALYGASATLSGPVTTGTIVEPLSGVGTNLAASGYEEQEYFASGTAHAFKATSDPSSGHMTIAPTTSAPYETRIIVRRPSSPKKFNGTVIVEWLNVSAGESSPDWDYLNPMLMNDGYAWVGVTAQALAVGGGSSILGTQTGGGLVQKEPSRYGSLHHPGDQYSLDMYAQIGLALRKNHGADVFGSLHPHHIVAIGESQSAFYMTDFADALQPVTHAYDGIFIHSRGAGGAGIGTGTGLKGKLLIRTDLSVPVFMFETQTDLTTLGYAASQQPNTARIRTWEVAGTSHADAYLVGGNGGLLGCTQPINDGPQHQVVQAAFTAFDKWVVDGTAPPTPAFFHLASTNPTTYALDQYGNVIGGVRTPAVDVPLSALSGAAPAGATVICSLFGSATPLSASTLTTLYPTKADYIADYTKSLDKAIKGGYILAADRSAMLAQAEQAPIS